MDQDKDFDMSRSGGVRSGSVGRGLVWIKRKTLMRQGPVRRGRAR